LNTYTTDEIRKLYELISVVGDNVNQHAVACRIDCEHLPTDRIGQQSAWAALRHALDFIATKAEREAFDDAVFGAPLDQMPLLINVTDRREIIARWRLSIAK
jgi:hypothetical protein